MSTSPHIEFRIVVFLKSHYIFIQIYELFYLLIFHQHAFFLNHAQFVKIISPRTSPNNYIGFFL